MGQTPHPEGVWVTHIFHYLLSSNHETFRKVGRSAPEPSWLLSEREVKSPGSPLFHSPGSEVIVLESPNPSLFDPFLQQAPVSDCTGTWEEPPRAIPIQGKIRHVSQPHSIVSFVTMTKRCLIVHYPKRKSPSCPDVSTLTRHRGNLAQA